MSRFITLIVGWIILTFAVMVTVLIFPGIDVDWSPGIYWAIAAVFAFVNVVFGWILRILSLPLILATWGLLCLVLNALLFLVTDSLMDSLHVDSFWAALGGSVVIALMAAVIEGIGRSFEGDMSPST